VVALAAGALGGCRDHHGPPATARTTADAPRTFDAAPSYQARVAQLRAALAVDSIELETATEAAAVLIRTSACANLPAIVHVDGMTLVINEHGCFRCELASDSSETGDVANVVAGYAAAVASYPPELIRASGIEHVALCWSLAGDSEDGAPSQPDMMEVGGTVDLHAHRLLLALEPLSYGYESVGLRGDEVLHHELFHILDVAAMAKVSLDDDAWLAVNPPGFSYRGLEEEDESGLAGFIVPHATANDREDRASVYQWLVARPNELCAEAETDPVIAAKARLIWTRIRAITPASEAFLARQAPCFATWIQDHP